MLIRKIPNDYSLKDDYLKIHSKEIKILILGSSHAYFDIDPEFISGKCFNAAYVSQTLYYDNLIFKKFSWDSLKYIIIPVDYFSFFADLENSIESWRVKNYQLYYHFYSSIKPESNFEILSNKVDYNFHKLKEYYYNEYAYTTQSNLGFGTVYDSSKKNDLMKTGIEAAKRHTVNTNKYFDKDFNSLKSILQIAEQKNIKVLLICSPAYHSYYDNLEKRQMNISITVGKQLEHDFANCSYNNFLKDSSFTAEDFYDADHLNNRGARKLSIKINSLLLK